MVEIAEKYPQYGFAEHKGYGTKSHMAAIRKHGPCPYHRMTFAPMKHMPGGSEYVEPEGQQGGHEKKSEDSAAADATSSSSSSMRFESIDELTAELRTLRGDPLEKDGGKIVVYRGSPKARVMVIGEAPGAEEDAKGVPFVGRAGQLLDKIFAAVTIDSNRHCYVTNVVKRRPLNNRDPTAAEIAFYSGYLEEEIRLVDPAIIVLTGRHSMRALLGKNTPGITKIRGTWYEIDGRMVMPMFHPSYLLRNPQRTPGSPKALTWDDVREVKRKIDEMGLIESEVEVDSI